MAWRLAPVPRMVDLAALLLRDYELHGRRSAGRARAALAHLGRYFLELDPARSYELTSRYVIRRRGSGAAPATVRYEISILGRALTLAARVGLIVGRPYLARPSVHNARQGFVDPASFRVLLSHLPQPIRDAALFAYVTGWRRAEVFGLTWDRVDFSGGEIRLPGLLSKNLEPRVFPFGSHPRLRRMLEQRGVARSGPLVFGWEHGGPVVTFDRPWKKACRDAGLGNTVFHDLRRSAARNLIRSGAPEPVAMAIMGHKTREIFRRYCIVREDDKQRAVARLAREPVNGRRGRRDEEEGTEEERRRGGDGASAGEEVVREASP